MLALIPFAFYKYGESIRRRSRFAPTAPQPRPGDVEHQAQSEELVSGEPTVSTELTDKEAHKPVGEVEDNDGESS